VTLMRQILINNNSKALTLCPIYADRYLESEKGLENVSVPKKLGCWVLLGIESQNWDVGFC